MENLIQNQEKSRDYQRIHKVIAHLGSHYQDQPSLEDISSLMGLSPWHFQRLFQRWAGLTPKQFLQVLTLEHAKQSLKKSASVLDAALDAGLSGPGRLHDLMVNIEGVTPGTFKAEGQGLTLHYGFHPTPFGPCLLALSDRGICGLEFNGEKSKALESLKKRMPLATLKADEAATGALVSQIFSGEGFRLKLLVEGSHFQIMVWKALLAIPPGGLSTYGQIARAVKKPGAAQAVGQALGENPIAWLIPCHRVIKSSGALGGYRWGTERKMAMQAWETKGRASV